MYFLCFVLLMSGFICYFRMFLIVGYVLWLEVVCWKVWWGFLFDDLKCGWNKNEGNVKCFSEKYEEGG